ncbi:MAG: hypothetical protein PHU56_04025 [Candidatus Pacebacteria bacterium]|nr:hypothetical protein [Candidatus Paceibacterota bacterium]
MSTHYTAQIKQCQNCRKDFSVEPEDFIFYEKVKVPPPAWCPECRDKRRFCFRNGHSLYKRKCDLCGVDVVSRISPDKPYKMYCQKCWWGDKWDSLEHGRDYDFSRPFFEQFKELLAATPHVSIFNTNTVNSEWVNQETDDKNCYLNVGGHFNEDSAYNTFEVRGKNCFDNFWVWQCELCYGNVNLERCWKTVFSQDCFDCLGLAFCFDMRNCQDCFGCCGLRGKQYYIFNQPHSKEEYQKFLQNNPLSSYKNILDLKKKSQDVWLSMPHRFASIIKSVNSAGCYITESKNVKDAWYVDKCEDARFLYTVAGLKDCYDCSSLGWGELCYETGHSNGLSASKFCLYANGGGAADKIGSYNLEYCFATPSSSNCFGCCNIKNQEYCILNKKHSKDEYKQLVEKIKKQMAETPYVDRKGRVYKYGEFFPIEFSPFGYNETTVQDYYPLVKEQAVEQGFNWSDYESDVKYEFSGYQIPDDIREVNDDVLQKVLKCEVSGKGYRIIPMELQFYRQMGLAMPRRAPLQRHRDRLNQLLPPKSFHRMCQCQTATHNHENGRCSSAIDTPYSSDRPEIVYCEDCYLKEIA